MILIDGHNLIGQMPDLSLDHPHDEEVLLSRLRAYHASTGAELVVYFDPGPVYQPLRRRVEAGITVYVAPYGHQADELILQAIRSAANPRQLTVVSSDHTIQQAARQRGCRVMDACAFIAELQRPRRRRPRMRMRRRSDAAAPLSEEAVARWLELFQRRARRARPETRR
ncbi:MAG: NYN domain-containing protein [Anaerolineae bacterium]